ncbi:MAG: N-acetyltransferase [Chitinophagaceae bacterium]|nr:MAG: N-acetyltransferase [Chitinophagaceae bacterium]
MTDLIFTTSRLYVRRFTEADEDNFFRLNSDQEVMLYIRKVKDREESKHFLLQNIGAYSKNPMTGRWAVHEKNGDRFVGTFAIIPLENTSYWQVGYALLKDDWGKGYATELTETGLQYAFRKMLVSKLTAVTEQSNHASMHVLGKTGFKQLENFQQDGKELCLFEIINPAVVETDRLLIAALDNPQLHLYIAANNKLEQELGLKVGDRVLSQDLREMIDQITVPAMREANENNYFFYTLWIVIDKTRNRLVAELGFKGEPGEDGSIEIGYGTFPLSRGQGYMTEAVSGMIGWAKNFPDITSIKAETEEDNIPSIRVLQKAGFIQTGKKGTMVTWKLTFQS